MRFGVVTYIDAPKAFLLDFRSQAFVVPLFLRAELAGMAVNAVFFPVQRTTSGVGDRPNRHNMTTTTATTTTTPKLGRCGRLI